MSVINGSLNAVRHSLIITWEKVSQLFSSVLKMIKSRDLLYAALRGHAFRPYNSTGKHLTFNTCTVYVLTMALYCYKNDVDRLFQCFCTSLYGCELCLLTTNEIEDLCVLWCLPSTSHSYFLPILSQCLPLYDENCRRSINFIRSCFSNESSLVRHIIQYAVFYGRALSCLGHNVLFCMRRLYCSIRDLSESANNIIKSFIFRLFDKKCTVLLFFYLS